MIDMQWEQEKLSALQRIVGFLLLSFEICCFEGK